MVSIKQQRNYRLTQCCVLQQRCDIIRKLLHIVCYFPFILVFSPMLLYLYRSYLNVGSESLLALQYQQASNGALSPPLRQTATGTELNARTKTETTPRRKTEDYTNVPAYVVSLIKCRGDGTVGFLDAAAVLRHSVHRNSLHHPGSNGTYSYKMYAIVHEDCARHAPVLESVGYRTIVRGTPIDRREIKNEFYRKSVEGELCCGSAEFIKMYAYTLTEHPVVVHFDLDKIVVKPMDDLFDAIIYDYDSPKGVAARKNIDVEWPEDTLPQKIDAFFTRDYTLSWPWKKIAGVQGGLLVVRPNEEYFQRYMDIILMGNYTAGNDNTCGWDGLGYGGWIGAKAFQGVVAYFYGHVVPGTAVELDVCKWNQVAADVIWRGPRGKLRISCRSIARSLALARGVDVRGHRLTIKPRIVPSPHTTTNDIGHRERR